MKAFKFKTGTFIHSKCKVGKGTIIVIDEINKKGITHIKIQGKSGRTAIPNFSIYNNILEEIDITQEYYENLIDMPESLIKKKDFLTILAKKYPYFSSKNVFGDDPSGPIDTLYTWIFQSKGSKDITHKKWISWKNDSKSLIDDDVISGFKSKPGSAIFNRSQRNNIITNEIEWLSDLNEILPNGIRENDFADFKEQEKIYDKLITEFLSLSGIPKEMIYFCESEKIVSNIKPGTHCDYITHEILDVSLFKKNGHHSKKKGLELCHKDPHIGTTAYNITIGSSESNREQGGYSLNRKACDGMRIKIIEYGNLNPIEIQNINSLVEYNNDKELMRILSEVYLCKIKKES